MSIYRQSGENEVYSPFDKNTTYKAAYAAANSCGRIKRSSESLGSINLKYVGFMVNPVNIQVSIIPQSTGGCTVRCTGDSLDGAVGLGSVRKAFDAFFQSLSNELGKIDTSQEAEVLKGIASSNSAFTTDNTQKISVNQDNISSVLSRISMFLEDEDWAKADIYCEGVLDYKYDCAEAYLFKLLASLHKKNFESLSTIKEPLDNNKDYLKALKFADDDLAQKLKACNDSINERILNAANDERYEEAVALLNSGDKYKVFRAKDKFTDIINWKDSESKIKECDIALERIELETQEQLKQDQAEKIIAEKKKKKKAIRFFIIFILLISGSILGWYVFKINGYNNAVKDWNSGKLLSAINVFTKDPNYKDSQSYIDEFSDAIAVQFEGAKILWEDIDSSSAGFDTESTTTYFADGIISTERVHNYRSAWHPNWITEKSNYNGAYYISVSEDYIRLVQKRDDSPYWYCQGYITVDEDGEIIELHGEIDNLVDHIKIKLYNRNWKIGEPVDLRTH